MKKNNNDWDVIVAGGGSSGVAAAVSSARQGLRTLLIERLGFLGGTSTGSLVTPMMKNAGYNGEIYTEILDRLNTTGDSAVHENGNPGWFNPEMMKCILDDVCLESGANILFDTVITGVQAEAGKVLNLTCYNKSGFSTISAKAFIDATGDADLCALAGASFEKGDEYGKNQALSLRFMMSNIDMETFAAWIKEIDPEPDMSVVCRDDKGQLLVTTAHTWDGEKWKLRPYFEKAVEDGVLKSEDGAYFQLFSIPGQPGAAGFNCPRIYAEKSLDTLDMWDISYAYSTGRKQIRRIAEFCKRYLKGFEGAYVSQIAPLLGVRDSRRIEGEYKLTEEDIFNAKKFENPVAYSDYPVDVHSREKGKSELKFIPEGEYYEIPQESLIPKGFKNLLVVGRGISATFRAQASLRIQPNCWSMGEYAGKMAKDIVSS